MKKVAGVDEVGRGSLVGPVYAAAVIFKKNIDKSKIKDSKKLSKKKPDEILKLAVKRMLPGGPLAKKQLSKLKIYTGENHPHTSQSPETIDISKLNNKNVLRK